MIVYARSMSARVMDIWSRSPEQALELLGVDGARERVLAIDEAALHELGQRLLERERSLLARDRDLLVQVLQRVLAHVLARAVADDQQLRGRNPAAADFRHQRLDQHGRQRHRELLA